MRLVNNATFYSSGTVTVTGNTGVVATPLYPTADNWGQRVAVPLYFTVAGSDMATDETNDVTIAWYADSSGTFTLGTTTFTQMTAGAPTPAPEVWTGDVTAFDKANATGPAYVPLLPYCKITHTLGGTTKSMSYIILMSYLLMD